MIFLKKHLLISLKGLLLGFVSLAIPGLSASTIAILVGIYFTLINSISNIFKEFKKSIKFLSFLLLGFCTGSILAALTVDLIYTTFPLVIILAALGFIIGGIPNMVKKIKSGFKKPSCWIIFIIITFILSFYSYFITDGQVVTFDNMGLADYITLFIIGVITASTLVIPGVDFAVLLLALGYYHSIVGIVANLFAGNILNNFIVLGVFFGGYLIGCLLFSKLIKFLSKKYSIQMQFANFAFVIASIPIIIKKCMIDNPNYQYSTGQLIFGIVVAIIGLIIMIVIPQNDELENKLVEEIDEKVTINVVNIDTAKVDEEEKTVFQNNDEDEDVVYEKEKTDIRNI